MPKKRMKRHAVDQPLDTSYRLIALTKGQNAIVDANDFEWLDQWNWLASWDPTTRSFYAVRAEAITQRKIYMHKEIIDCGEDDGDHKNNNSLDNRRQNLRRATRMQNGGNRRINSDNTSGYKGVTWFKKFSKWGSYIYISGRRKHLGYFLTAEEAAKAYDDAAKQRWGDFAHPNFSNSTD